MFLGFGIHSYPLSSLQGTLRATCSDTFHKLLNIPELVAFQNLEFWKYFFWVFLIYIEYAFPTWKPKIIQRLVNFNKKVFITAFLKRKTTAVFRNTVLYFVKVFH